ncbi:YraN family protein [Parachryseolinea silvisoli]|jgi:putative endonuclease|uniref:YraN family protein n=1 Tax=Parachryseolinea silvisoli TaxID=2873601 RepID=UPI002265B836|nr:YraN family protein [Parachryseolinea silvisoli]MCD9016434.1 YraN family protein [Parachryseolinea silvisoli]
MKTSTHLEIGKRGEQLAATFLEKKGYQILVRNYRASYTEIDLIVKRDNWIIFVEVKTRSSTAFGEPEQAVSALKARHIFRAAEHYIYSTNWQGHVRFDVVAVKLGFEPAIDHFEDAIN